MKKLLHSLALWLAQKTYPNALTGGQWSGTSFIDAYKRNRNPTPNELLAELKNTAWTCASINAAVCANFPPRLYVTTAREEPQARCRRRGIRHQTEERLRTLSHLPSKITKAYRIEEVLDHPLLDLFRNVNPVHNQYDLFELTTLYQEVLGSAYWYLSFGPFGVPDEIWVLPSQNVTPTRDPKSTKLVDYYEYRVGTQEQRFSPKEIIHFRYPDPRNPYTGGLGPLRACYEQVALSSDYAAFKKATWENYAVPSAVISPAEVIGEEERDRLETQWNQKYRRGGAGKVLIAESEMKVNILSHSMGDLAALADYGATKEDIANAFHVPLSFLTKETNLANLTAAEHQHMAKAISPRLIRRDEKINEQLIPLYDPSGRLFVASEDPVPVDPNQIWQQYKADLQFGVITINEIRSERGLAPLPWGDVPFLPANWWPADQPRTSAPTSDLKPDAADDINQEN